MIKKAALLLGLVLLISCRTPQPNTKVSGSINWFVTMPLTTRFENTKVGTKRVVIDQFKVKEPFSGAGLSAEWNKNVIIDMAKQAGLKDIHYIDIEVFSFFGIFTSRNYIVYGD